MSLENALIAIEQHIERVSRTLLATDAQALEEASSGLRDAAISFSRLLESAQAQRGSLPPGFQKRLDGVVALLAVQRENLARLAAITDRQVACLVPTAQPVASTYGSALGGRQGAGAAARIYRALS